MISESAQIKIGVRRSTRVKFDKARKMTGMKMTDIADKAIEDFLEYRAPKYAEAGA